MGSDIENFYTLEEELGRGGQAIVYKMKRKVDGKFFACKTIRVSDYAIEDSITDDTLPDGGLREEAEAEIEALVHLSKMHSPSGGAMVPELVEVFRDEDYYHLVMELCQCSLRDVLLRKKRLSEHEAAIVIKQVAKAVHKMHRRGVTHRDIKPGNILLGFGESLFGNVKLADFGTSSRFSKKGSPPGMIMRGMVGTERYRAPEMSSPGCVYDERVDVWSMGIVLYEMLSGKCAFPGLASQEIEKRLGCLEDLPISSLDWIGINNEAKKLILHLLNIDPEKRLSLQKVKKHPWVVRNLSSPQHELTMEKLQDQTKAGKMSLKLVFQQSEPGKWCVKRKREEEHLKTIMIEPKKIRLRCINGAWQTVH
ncbi:calcium-dependent protein kinase 33 [Selaginella moellendorffii]|uniref:calcium-dependent protein kinase 33 n=1 Tax=Selaginella moellendorffii TaxID=88036 RepID=UPI000D1C7780|nr:calcium-dependent protein kinase 33 [Selaginella moellendorffii]|eukprot:XP_024517955.1 calcium-dependent protein kinase 33 [Selaginella moellendorffii]